MRVIFYPLLRDCTYWRPLLRQTPEGQTRLSWTKSRPIFRTEKKWNIVFVYQLWINEILTNTFCWRVLSASKRSPPRISTAALLCCLPLFPPFSDSWEAPGMLFLSLANTPSGEAHSDATIMFKMVHSAPNLFKALRVGDWTLLVKGDVLQEYSLLYYPCFCFKIQSVPTSQQCDCLSWKKETFTMCIYIVIHKCIYFLHPLATSV